jgi:hypothetical protein
MKLDDAMAVADAVLFEGYALYPYRASSAKNRYRWQFGVLAPRAWSEGGGGDPWWQETQCLVAPADRPVRLQGLLRFMRLCRRDAGVLAQATPWDEGEIEKIEFEVPLASLTTDGELVVPFRLTGRSGLESGNAFPTSQPLQSWPLAGVVRVGAEPVPGVAKPLIHLRARVENVTAWITPGEPRNEALRASLLGTHLFLGVEGGDFLSLIDPPKWAAAAAASCRNVRTYPVLAGNAGRCDLLLSAPVILEDHPRVAPESPRDLFDATEIDEILTLRILTLTHTEKREMRATDPRLGALLDSVERLGPEEMARLHGVTRELRELDPAPSAPAAIQIGGATVGPGSRVRLRPGTRRSDAQDMFLAGLPATVEAVMRDVEDRDCLAVTIDDDPARELLRWQRRFHYFYPDEVEPLDPARAGSQ